MIGGASAAAKVKPSAEPIVSPTVYQMNTVKAAHKIALVNNNLGLGKNDSNITTPNKYHRDDEIKKSSSSTSLLNAIAFTRPSAINTVSIAVPP